jgi:hypothetical protein
MAVPLNLIPVIRELVHELVKGNYEGLEADGRAGRLTAEELRQSITSYGGTIIELPNEAFETADAIPIEGEPNCWAVDVDLWTAEEGQSDLTLSLTVCVTPEGMIAQIDDLHVL